MENKTDRIFLVALKASQHRFLSHAAQYILLNLWNSLDVVVPRRAI